MDEKTVNGSQVTIEIVICSHNRIEVVKSVFTLWFVEESMAKLSCESFQNVGKWFQEFEEMVDMLGLKCIGWFMQNDWWRDW